MQCRSVSATNSAGDEPQRTMFGRFSHMSRGRRLRDRHPSSRNVCSIKTFGSVEERNQYIRFSAIKCNGLYIFYKLWSAAKILDVTKEEMKLLVSERKSSGRHC